MSDLGLRKGFVVCSRVMPNAEYVAYRETDGRPAPDDDLIARLTLHVQF